MDKFTVNKLPKSEIEILFSVPWSEIKESYGKIVKETAKKTQVKGFRKGKAPDKLVEENLDKTKVYSEVIQNLLPSYYEEAVKNNNLKPISSPKISLTSASEGKDWEIKVVLAEKPNFSLDNYREQIKSLFKGGEIWTPGKQKTEPAKDPKILKDEKIQKIVEWLLKNIKIELSDLLLTDEINRRLAGLIDQTAKLGMTVEQYLSSVGKTSEQIREEYRQQVEEMWKLEFILNEIAEKENVVVEDKNIDEFIQKSQDEQQRKELESQRYVLASIIRRQKTLDFLASL